jgi:hypothetical protein
MPPHARYGTSCSRAGNPKRMAAAMKMSAVPSHPIRLKILFTMFNT